MSRSLTPPMAQIPIGLATINGKQVEVRQHPEFVRFFFDLFSRVGKTDALSNTELAELAEALVAAPVSGSSPEAQEALRAVDELRNEVATLRGSNDRLRAELDELRGQVEPMPSLRPLEGRIQQIEDRLN